MDDVVVLAFSSLRSDPIQHRKWRRLREMHTYSAPTTPPSRSSEIWWSGRWDQQHDGVVSMVESMRRQGFACLRGGERTEKGGFRKRAAASRKLDQPKPRRCGPFYSRPILHQGLGHAGLLPPAIASLGANMPGTSMQWRGVHDRVWLMWPGLAPGPAALGPTSQGPAGHPC
jgi:hypothetical protein